MKRFSALTVAFLLAVLFSVTAFAALTGDADSNGDITAADARLILRFSCGAQEPGDEQRKTSDVNSDGKITAADARIVLRVAASIEKMPETKDPVNVTLKKGETNILLSANEVYKKASGYTVEVMTFSQSGTAYSVGSGFFINENTVVTNFHVIKDVYYAKIKTADNKVADVVSVLGYDEGKDIALLEVSMQNDCYAEVSDGAEVGDKVYTLGSTQGFTGTFTDGIVSQVNRKFTELNNSVGYIQFTAPVSEGNSGGPVLDENGNVAGIVAMSHDPGQNINFAIPLNEVESIDVSQPKTIAEFYENYKNEKEFSGQLSLSSAGVTLKKGGTAFVYAVVNATEEYSLVCTSDNDAVTVKKGRCYGNVNVIYISAKEDNCTAKVKVYIDGHEDVASTLTVTAGGSAPDVYVGISGDVPDFGVVTGVAPDDYDENTLDGKNCYSFSYSFDSLNAAGINSEKIMNEYTSLLKDHGYRQASVAEDNTSVTFYSNNESTCVIFGMTQADGEYYMYVLIIR